MLGKGKITKELKSILRQIQGQKGYYKNSNLYTTSKEFEEMKAIEDIVNNISIEVNELRNGLNKNRRI